MREFFSLLTGLAAKRGFDERQPLTGIQSRPWGVATWMMALGGVGALLSFNEISLRLLLLFVLLFLAGLLVVIAGAVVDLLRR